MYQGENTAGALTALVVLSIVAGMIISVIRASTLDHTFEGTLQFSTTILQRFERLKALSVIGVYLRRLPKHRLDGSILHGQERVEPDYVVIAARKRLDVLREAIISDKRPYQFYGNTILAILIYVILLIPTGFSGTFSLDRTLRITVLIVSMVPLFTAARTSHNRFMRSVNAMNTRP